MFGFKLPASRFKVRAVIPTIPYQHPYDILSLSQNRGHIIGLVTQILGIDGKFRRKLSVIRTHSVHAELICSVTGGVNARSFYAVSYTKFFAKIFCRVLPAGSGFYLFHRERRFHPLGRPFFLHKSCLKG